MKKLKYIDVKKYIESFDYKLLSKEYINNYTKLKLQCPKGHIFLITYSDFQQKHRCSECFSKKKHTLEEIKTYFKKFGYELLSKEYKNAFQKLKIKCPENHNFEISYNSFQQGIRCAECSGKKIHILSNVKKYIESFDYKLLSTEYINTHHKLKLQCPNGHIYNVKYNDFQQGRRCPYCASVLGWSKPEKEIAEYTKTIYSGEVIENDRTQVKNYLTGKNLELDIFLPEVNKAIEYNGTYWHSLEYAKIKDIIKQEQCIQKNIDLLVIQEQDWCDDKLSCLNKINVFLENIERGVE